MGRKIYLIFQIPNTIFSLLPEAAVTDWAGPRHLLPPPSQTVGQRAPRLGMEEIELTYSVS